MADHVSDIFEKGMIDTTEHMIPFLHMLMDGISDYIFLMEVVAPNRFKYVLVNQSAKTRHPIENAEWEGRFIEDLLESDKAKPLIDRYQNVFDQNRPLTYEDEMDLDGKVFRGHTSLTPLKNQSGDVTYILGITRDISDVVEKERVLNRINAVYRSLMENTADAILVIDTNQKVVEVNSALEQLYGFSKQELSEDVYPFIPIEKQEEAQSLIDQALDNEGVSGFQTVRERKDGTRIDVSMTVSPIHNEMGETIGISSIVRDITHIKENERKLSASRSRYHSLFKHNPHPILTLNLDGTVQNANPASLKMMNKSDDELSGVSLSELLPDEQAKWVEEYCQHKGLEEDVWFQTSLRVNQEERIANVFLVPIINQDERVGMYAILDDITGKERATEALRQSEAKFRLIADHSNDLICVFSPYGELYYASPSLTKFFGFNPAELPKEQITQMIQFDDLKRVSSAFKQCFKDGQAFTVTLEMTGKAGKAVWFECRGTPVLSDEGTVNRIVVVARDISEQKKYEDQLKRIAFYDYLTGLPNRRLFEDRLERAIVQAARNDQSFALLYLDGDSFKRINDEYGHDMGDDFLRLVGNRMKECLRERDSIGRIGGDEFAILLNDIQDTDHVRQISQRILDQLRLPYQLNGVKVVSSFSIGVSMYPVDGEALDDLFRTADQALYYGKREGKDQIWMYEDL